MKLPKQSNLQIDQELVLRVQRGDKVAFDRLVLKYQHKIIQLVNRYVRNPSEAQDVAQETFLKAYRALPNFRGDSAFYTWLYRIAINTAKNYLVFRMRRGLDYQVDIQESEKFDASLYLKNLDTPDKLLIKDEIIATISLAVDELPEEMRIAILLREFDAMSYEDIAATMECPVGTVRSRISRAREAIDKKLRRVFDLGVNASER